jgi:cell wall-associated NlpC family hydrolase
LPSAIVVLLLVIGAGGCGGGGSSSDPAESPTQPRSRIEEERPPHPQPPYDVASQAQEAKRVSASKPKPAPAATSSSPASMPPASAGTNGSYVPPASGEYKRITPRTVARLEQQEAAGLAVLLNGIALAPPDAPEAIKAAISAANEIVGRPYVWGGGHQSWYSAGYDCSGAVSYALGAGGFLPAPLDSSRLEAWGAPGPGRWMTVYANAGHAYAVIAGLRWDTVGDARGTGPRWHAEMPYPQGFVARHPPGY